MSQVVSIFTGVAAGTIAYNIAKIIWIKFLTGGF